MGSRSQRDFSQGITEKIKNVAIKLTRRHLHRTNSLAYPSSILSTSTCHSESSTLIDDLFEGSLISLMEKHGKATNRSQSQMTIGMLQLPDNALLKTFEFYLDEARIEGWITLMHVSRKWRSVVLGSARRLNLRLHYRARTRVREAVDIWPLFPIVISGNDSQESGVDNVIAALEHNDRVCGVELWDVQCFQMEKVLAAMQVSFPALTYLDLASKDKMGPVVPDSFLGGSAPRLRSLSLNQIPFPSLPRLLLSAADLVNLSLCGITASGYISPEAMVAGLSTLARLKSLWLEFKHPLWESRRSPPARRAHLPALTHFEFNGFCEYFQELVARIDTPLLDHLNVTFSNQFAFDTAQFAEFISRTPNFNAPDEAYVKFSDSSVSLTLPRRGTFDGTLHLSILCTDSLWQLSSLTHLCTSPLYRALIPTVEHLYILDAGFLRPCWQDDIMEEESSQWLELFRSFTALKDLYLHREFVPYFSATLQGLGAVSVAEVLPALQKIFLEDPWLSGSVRGVIQQFVSLRRPSGNPVVVSLWNTGREKYKWHEIVEW